MLKSGKWASPIGRLHSLGGLGQGARTLGPHAQNKPRYTKLGWDSPDGPRFGSNVPRSLSLREGGAVAKSAGGPDRARRLTMDARSGTAEFSILKAHFSR